MLVIGNVETEEMQSLKSGLQKKQDLSIAFENRAWREIHLRSIGNLKATR